MQNFRFHVVALPHTVTSKEFCACAYTQKVLNFCKMMKSLGHTVFHYGTNGSIVDCDEHITVISRDEQIELINDTDWRTKGFKIDWDPNLPYWVASNNSAAAAINKRKQAKDFLCLIGGTCHKPIADQVQEFTSKNNMKHDVHVVEYGVGYPGIFSRFCVFESYAWMHNVYGMAKIIDGRYYDAVIPNYFDPLDFPMTPKENKKNYLLYIGRLIKRKGIQAAVDISNYSGMKLFLAGQGCKEQGDGYIKSEEGLTFTGKNIYHVGLLDVPARAKMMGEARAVLVPTDYLEPFGGVNVEAQMCGTPVISTDHGVFPETVIHGVTGYRCRTLEQYVWAAKNVHKLDTTKIREWAVNNYSIDRVKLMYQEYFEMLYGLWDKGWYNINPNKTNLEWLRKYYPEN